jgi:hypothetical protein
MALKTGIDPNFIISIGMVEERDTREAFLDKIFLVKKIMGECPTLLHFAVVNIYYRCCGGRVLMFPRQRRAEVDRAHQILKLLLQFSGNAYQPSIVIFSGDRDAAEGQAIGPFHLAETIYKVAISLQMRRLVEIMSASLESMTGNDSDHEPRDIVGDDEGSEDDEGMAINEGGTLEQGISKENLDGLVALFFANFVPNGSLTGQLSSVITSPGGMLLICTNEYVSHEDEKFYSERQSKVLEEERDP